LANGDVEVDALFRREDPGGFIFPPVVEELIGNRIDIWSLGDKFNPELSAKLTLVKGQRTVFQPLEEMWQDGVVGDKLEIFDPNMHRYVRNGLKDVLFVYECK